MLIENLEKFGLSYKEATVYLTLLRLGPSTVNEIAKRSDMNRSTTYVLLDSLIRHGLVNISNKEGGIKTYIAAPPEHLIQFLETSQKKYSELIDIAKGLLPELKTMYVGVGPEPRIRYFEGAEGLKTAYEDTLTSHETIRAYASIENMHRALPDYFPEYYHRRAKRGINIRAIFPDTPEARERVKHNRDEAREAYLVPRNTYAFSPEINIYDDKIVFMSLVERFSLIIESHELADALKKAFELSWQEAKRLNRSVKK